MDAEAFAVHSRNIRRHILDAALNCGTAAHLGGSLSLADILCVLYGSDLTNLSKKDIPESERDRFILSKGHSALGLYATLFEYGVIKKDVFETFQKDGSYLVTHPVMCKEYGIESSSGSLGQGISFAVGLALNAQKKGKSYRTYVLCGNGECNEGSVWEAAMSIVNFNLTNLVLIIDNNKMQSDGASENVMNISTKYSAMLTALGFNVFDVDGHNTNDLYESFLKARTASKPVAIVANTIKGKGVGFMENNPAWHHGRLTQSLYEQAIGELEAP